MGELQRRNYTHSLSLFLSRVTRRFLLQFNPTQTRVKKHTSSSREKIHSCSRSSIRSSGLRERERCDGPSRVAGDVREKGRRGVSRTQSLERGTTTDDSECLDADTEGDPRRHPVSSSSVSPPPPCHPRRLSLFLSRPLTAPPTYNIDDCYREFPSLAARPCAAVVLHDIRERRFPKGEITRVI